MQKTLLSSGSINDYWDYYREIEDDFLSTRKYVSFEPGNFSTYSLEYLKLFQIVCGEIDVIGKVIAHSVNSDFDIKDKKNNINKWWYEIQDIQVPYNKPGTAGKVALSDSTCIFLGSIVQAPWKSFRIKKTKDKLDRPYMKLAEGSSTPEWWKDHNKVKHMRLIPSSNERQEGNYSKANLGNLIKSLSALYLLEILYLQILESNFESANSLSESMIFS